MEDNGDAMEPHQIFTGSSETSTPQGQEASRGHGNHDCQENCGEATKRPTTVQSNVQLRRSQSDTPTYASKLHIPKRKLVEETSR
ncbi:hypothetical protein HPB50_028665 [Hyalomma asiaticum]|nr:hypothetical protein HPB50_028665 [Hyalomma asiaticum]